jgi:hypothetical protein
VRLYDDVLHVSPTAAQRLLRAVNVAKSGARDEARAELAAIAPALPRDDAETAHLVAKLNAVCGQRTAALDAVRRAVDLGASACLLRTEDEFRAIVDDPAFPRCAR